MNHQRKNNCSDDLKKAPPKAIILEGELRKREEELAVAVKELKKKEGEIAGIQ